VPYPGHAAAVVGEEIRRDVRRAGVELMEIPATPDRTVDMVAALQELGQRGLTRVLVEGGSVTDAALESGYSSVSAYIAAFKQTFGYTPGAMLTCREPT